MNELEARRSTVVALVGALLCVAFVLVATLRARPAAEPALVRLLESCLDGKSELRWSADAVDGDLLAPVARWAFRGNRAGWLLLDEQLKPVADDERDANPWRPRRQPSEGDPAQPDDVLRFPTGRGVLALVVPVAGQRLLRLTARVRRTAPATPLPPALDERQALLFVQPLQSPIDLAAELARRSYAHVTSDPRVWFGPDTIWRSAPAPASGAFETLTLTLQTPASAQAMLVQFGAGDGAAGAAVDLESITLEAWTLRGFLGLGAAPRTDGPLTRTAPIDPRELPLLPPPDPARPALRKVEDLLERRDALVLPPPSEASLDVTLPDGELVLEYGLARVHEPRRNWNQLPVDVGVAIAAVDGSDLAIEREETLPASGPTGWQDRAIDVSALAGRRVRVSFTSATKASRDLIAIGAPIVRRRAPCDARPNVIVVSLDTVRADHWSCNGYARPTTPHLDRLAAESTWFRDVSSTSSYTLPAHGSLLTGQLPSRHGAESDRPGRNRLFTDRSDLLAVRLRDEGWLTTAFTGGVYLAPGFGFDQGFDRYDATDLALELETERAQRLPRAGDPAFNVAHRRSRTVDHALEWIRAHDDARFLLFLHTYLVHDYLAAPAHEAQFHGSCASKVPRGDLGLIRDRTIARKPEARDLDHFVDAYDAALHQADAAVGRLVATLRDLDLLERTILVVTSDHGEEFGDHGGVNHGRTLYEEMVRVPLLIRAPGFAPREVREPVSLVDVVPTLHELLGIEARHAIDGRSLVPAMRGEAIAPAALEAELNLAKSNRQAMRRAGARKSIGILDERNAEELEDEKATRIPPRRLLFAPGLDPGESVDLAADAQGDDAEILEELDRQRERMRERRREAKRDAAGEHRSSDRFEVQIGGYVEQSDEDDD